MKSLTRQQFLNLNWGVADLDAAAEFWLRLYERVASSRRYNPSPRHAIELRLTGFPVHAGDELRRELERRALASDVRRPDVHLRDPHTLVLYSEPERGGAAPPTGLGLPVLAGPPFDGLIAEVRFIASGREGGYIKTGTATVALVIIGELRNGKLLVKSIWRSGSSRWEDEVYWSNPYPEEAALIAGLEEFRRTGEVDNRLARRMFKESSEDHLGRWMMRLIYVPFGGPRLLSLLCRVAVLALLNVGLGILIYLTVAAEKWILLVPCVIFGLYVLTLSWHFFRYEVSWLKCRRALWAGYAAQYEESAGYAILPTDESEALCGDPAVAKCTAEILASGLVLAGDVVSRTPVDRYVIYRVFRALDGASYLVLICQLKGVQPSGWSYEMWPAAIALQAQTFFTSGGRVDSVSGMSYGYLRLPVGPNTLIRVDRESVDPITFLHSHAIATEKFAKELDLPAKPQESLEQFVRSQEAIHEEERQHFSDHGYSWSDHLRWYLQTPRREYRA